MRNPLGSLLSGRRWEGVLDAGAGQVLVSELEDVFWTLPVRVCIPHLVPPSTVARCDRLGPPLRAVHLALWLYDRWDGLGCLVGRRFGPLILPIRHFVIADGGEVELLGTEEIRLSYGREELNVEEWA